jgi:hypothetical protein
VIVGAAIAGSAVATGAASLIAAWWMEPHRRARRALRGVEEVPIAAVKPGVRARVTGVVSARGPLISSPVGQHPCIGYRLDVDTRVSGRTDARRRILQQQDWDVFWIEDATGKAAVDGPFLIGLDPDDGGWADLPPSLFAFLEENDIRPATRRLVGPEVEFRFSETLLKPGDRVTVLGRASLELDPAAQTGASRRPPMLCHLRGSKRQPVVVADADELDD